MVAMLHHHLFPITRDEFLKQRWREKMFVGKIMDSSKALVDSQDLIEWFRKHQIQYVLHGHKHLPFFTNHDGMYAVSYTHLDVYKRQVILLHQLYMMARH